MKKTFLITCLLTYSLVYSLSYGKTQSNTLKLSEKAEISLITCGPGTESYSVYGHSAFRVKDKLQGLDRIYNYGTFDFNVPNFEINFLKGNLNYFLSAYDFRYFLKSYQNENRWVKEQILDLNSSDVQKTFDYLENNALPENREYLYHYFFNNCSTQLLDVTKNVLGEKLITPKFSFKETTHRELIQLYLKNHPWADFVSNLVLGSVIDKSVSTREYVFLPDNLFSYYNTLKINKNGVLKPLIKQNLILLTAQKVTSKKSIFITPLLFFILLGLIIVWITIRNIKKQKRSKWLDFSIFFITGFIGCAISFMWLATNHISSANNFNNLWAFAPNLIVSFFLLKKQLPTWISKYAFFLLILLVINTISWIIQIQKFTIATLPILIFLGIRYYYLTKSKKKSLT